MNGTGTFFNGLIERRVQHLPSGTISTLVLRNVTQLPVKVVLGVKERRKRRKNGRRVQIIPLMIRTIAPGSTMQVFTHWNGGKEGFRIRASKSSSITVAAYGYNLKG